MIVASIIAAIAASLALILLVVIMLRLPGLQARSPAAELSASGGNRDVAEMKAMVETLRGAVRDQGRLLGRIAEQAGALLNEIEQRRTPDSGPPSPPAEPAPEPSLLPVEQDAGAPVTHQWRVDEAEESAGLETILASPKPRAAPVPAEPEPAEEADGSARIRQLIEQYRALVTRPQRQEINRWGEEHGAFSVEMLDDGSVRRQARESGGLLLLLPLDERFGMLLPGGGIVVDFSTSYATNLSLRPVTKAAFDLDADGAGVLRLGEPAWVEQVDDVWRLKQPGLIAGLRAD